MVVLTALLVTIILVGCGQTEAPAKEVTNPINTIEVEEILTEDILVEDIIIEENITYWDDVDTKNAKDLRHELAEKNLYFDTTDGVIIIYGTDYCFEDSKAMVKVEFDESTEEIKKVTMNPMVITKDVYDLLWNYTEVIKSDQIL